jgi:hypothetical protein
MIGLVQCHPGSVLKRSEPTPQTVRVEITYSSGLHDFTAVLVCRSARFDPVNKAITLEGLIIERIEGNFVVEGARFGPDDRYITIYLDKTMPYNIKVNGKYLLREISN